MALPRSPEKSRVSRRQVEKDETVQNRQLPLIEQRPEAFRRVGREVGDGHLSRQKKSHRTGEQTEEQEQAAPEFEQAGNPHQREEFELEWQRGRNAEELLPAVRQKKKGRDDPQDAEQPRLPANAQ